MQYRIPFFVFLCGLFSAQLSFGFVVPELTDPVMDNAGMMRPQDVEWLRATIRKFQAEGHGQIQVLTVPNIDGLPIEQVSIQITDKWKLGDQKKDDGVLVLIAAQERRMRIEVGQGLEGVLPDVIAKRIIDDIMAPAMRRDPSLGIVMGVQQIMSTVDGNFVADTAIQPRRGKRRAQLEDIPNFVIFIGILLFIIFGNLFGRRNRGFWGGGGGFGGGFGGGGFGGGSGGGWSGGGGGFSGGGSSGSW